MASKRKVVLRTFALTSALVGLLIIVLSRNHVVISRIAKATLSSASYEKVAKAIEIHATVFETPHEAFDQGDGASDFLELVYTANVRMTVEHPRSAFADDSFFVRALGLGFSVPPQATLASSKGRASANSNHPTHPSWSENNIRLLFEGGCLGLTLSMPGSAVSPSGVVPLNGGVAEWIVMPAHSGNHKGLIQIVEAPCDDRSLVALGKDLEQHRFDFINQDSSFSVEITDRLLTRERVFGWIGGFLGAFLTLPGIVAFIESQREKKRKRTDEEDKARRIIL